MRKINKLFFLLPPFAAEYPIRKKEKFFDISDVSRRGGKLTSFFLRQFSGLETTRGHSAKLLSPLVFRTTHIWLVFLQRLRPSSNLWPLTRVRWRRPRTSLWSAKSNVRRCATSPGSGTASPSTPTTRGSPWRRSESAPTPIRTILRVQSPS